MLYHSCLIPTMYASIDYHVLFFKYKLTLISFIKTIAIACLYFKTFCNILLIVVKYK